MRTNIGMESVVKLSKEENIVAPTTLRGSPNRKIRATEVAPREKATGSPMQRISIRRRMTSKNSDIYAAPPSVSAEAPFRASNRSTAISRNWRVRSRKPRKRGSCTNHIGTRRMVALSLLYRMLPPIIR